MAISGVRIGTIAATVMRSAYGAKRLACAMLTARATTPASSSSARSRKAMVIDG
jgi:hypothetical protein